MLLALLKKLCRAYEATAMLLATAKKKLYSPYGGGKTIDMGSGINLYRPFLALAMLLAMHKKNIQPISTTNDAIGNS